MKKMYRPSASIRSLRPLLLSLVLLIAGCTPIWSGNKMRQDIDQLRSEQDELTESLRAREAELTKMISSARADVDALNKIIRDATDLLARNSADFGAEMEVIRQELQSIRGHSEEVAFKLQKVEQDLQIFKEDVDLRFADGGGATLPDDANELFKVATEKVEAGETRAARKGFEKFIKVFPKDRRVDEALFWLGETYFKESRFPSAIFEYQKILQNYPKSDRMDDATFRIGESFARLNKCNEAKVFFETVVKDYQSSKFRAPAQQQIKSLGSCK